MDKEQQRLLVKAFELQSKILREIRDLAYMNKSLAYGCLRTGEIIIDVMFVDDLKDAAKKVLENTVPLPGTPEVTA